ncbi:MAG: FAD-dependent monooxygenase [Actinobacteria bacterium]|nr:FAD-dependent monooxygenase [Actinomycetota bacterium]
MSNEITLGTPERRALIVGCGIAGPVLAMFLKRAGIYPVIYEGQPEPNDEAGFFLNLALNGLDVLDTLGIKEDIESLGTPTTSIVFQNHRARRLGILPQTTTLLKRGLLNKVLREQAIRRGVTVEFGKRLKDVEITPQRTAIARFEDGTEARGDFLVGCDGIHSRTRRSIMPDAPEPRYAGLIDTGGFTTTAGVSPSGGVMRMTFGTEGFFGYQVVAFGEIFWFQNSTQAIEPDRKKLEAMANDQYRQRLLDMHRHDHEPIAKIIRSTESRIGRWPSYDMPSLPAWYEGPACLIGDAAHATLPSAGQGASMALEDAIVLAKCLRDLPDTEMAFAAFEALRKDRVEELVEQARRSGSRKVPTNALTRGIRDLALPFFLKVGAKNAERAYSYRVDWDEKVAWSAGTAREESADARPDPGPNCGR